MAFQMRKGGKLSPALIDERERLIRANAMLDPEIAHQALFLARNVARIADINNMLEDFASGKKVDKRQGVKRRRASAS